MTRLARLPKLFSLLLVALAGAIIWAPLACSTGYVFEDWGFLALARESRLAGYGLRSAVLHVSGDRAFFRPAGVGLWFILVERCNDVSIYAVRAASIALQAAALVAWMWAAHIWWSLWNPQSTPDSSTSSERQPALMVAALILASHPAWILPTSWTSAAAETQALLWSCLSLGCLGIGLSREKHGHLGFVTSSVLSCVLFVFALASKESAAMLPAIAALLMLRGGNTRPTFPAVGGVVLIGSLIVVAWMAIRATQVLPVHAGSPYEFVIGFNIPRNIASLGAFMMGVPRECLRAIVEQPGELGWEAGTWGLALAILTSVAWLSAVRVAYSPRGEEGTFGLLRRPGSIALLCAAVALAPYVALRWNCYAYYTVPALAWAALSLGAEWWQHVGRRGVMMTILACLLAQAGMITLPAPVGLPARARTASEDQQRIRDAESQLRARGLPLGVRIEDTPRAAALGGLRGIAGAVGISSDDTVEVIDGHAVPDLPNRWSGQPAHTSIVINGDGILLSP